MAGCHTTNFWKEQEIIGSVHRPTIPVAAASIKHQFESICRKYSPGGPRFGAQTELLVESSACLTRRKVLYFADWGAVWVPSLRIADHREVMVCTRRRTI